MSIQKYAIFNFTSIISGILLIFSLFFIPKPFNIMYIPFLFLIVVFLSTTVIKSNKFLEIFKFAYVFGLGIALRLLSTILPTSSDIFWVSKGSIHAILNGLSPYGIAFPVYNNPTIPTITLAYLPFTILFEIPFEALLGDLRYSIIFADIGIAVLLYLIIKVRNEDIARAASSFYLLLTFPLNFGTPLIISEYRIFNGVTDPIWILLILSAVYAYMKDKPLVASILIGLSIISKQFAILFFIPMLIMWLKKDEFGKRQYKLIAISLLIPIGIALPFILSTPHEFMRLTTYLSNESYRPEFPAIFSQLSFLGFDVPLIVAKAIQILSILLILVYFRNKLNNIHSLLRVFTLIFVVFLTLNNFTQFYYWFGTIPFLIITFATYYEYRNIDVKDQKYKS